MIVAICCCHVNEEMRLIHVMRNALHWGGSRKHETLCFSCQVAAAGDEGYLVCAAGAAGAVSMSNRFSARVLQRVAVQCTRFFVFLESVLADRKERLYDCCHVLLPCASKDAGYPCDAAKNIGMAA